VLSIFARKAAGALGASGFPCALDLSRDDVDASLGRTSRREKAEMCFKLAPLKFESAHGTATNSAAICVTPKTIGAKSN
jgi:hypothetical protein